MHFLISILISWGDIMDFEKNSKELLKVCYEIESQNDFKDYHKRKFWELIEFINISLLSSEDNFFGQFMIQIKREINFNITWPIATEVTLEGYKMHFNPFLMLPLSLKEMEALIKHEIYHIMYNHYERERSLKNKVSTLAINIAMDLSINQYIKNLPAFCKKLHTVNIEYDLDLKEDMPIEVYAEEIQKAIDKRKNKKVIKKDSNIQRSIDLERAHELWERGELTLDNIKDIKKRTSKSAYKGKAPKDIEKMILSFDEKEEIDWKSHLKRLLNTSKIGYKKTITRKDRRQPDRLDIRGVLPNNIPEILVAIDISASMSDGEIKSIMKEILALCRNKLGKIKVIECDNQIRRVYELKSTKDIKQRMNKSGATQFSPVFNYIKENNYRNHILIYFTDGVGEKELKVKPINYKTIWVLTSKDNLSLDKNYGVVTRLERVQVEGYGYDYGLQAVRDAIHDWAR